MTVPPLIFNAKYIMWQMEPSGRMGGRFEFIGYHSGHIMYLLKEKLEKGYSHIRFFIEKPWKKENLLNIRFQNV